MQQTPSALVRFVRGLLVLLEPWLLLALEIRSLLEQFVRNYPAGQWTSCSASFAKSLPSFFEKCVASHVSLDSHPSSGNVAQGPFDLKLNEEVESAQEDRLEVNFMFQINMNFYTLKNPFSSFVFCLC